MAYAPVSSPPSLLLRFSCPFPSSVADVETWSLTSYSPHRPLATFFSYDDKLSCCYSQGKLLIWTDILGGEIRTALRLSGVMGGLPS